VSYVSLFGEVEEVQKEERKKKKLRSAIFGCHGGSFAHGAYFIRKDNFLQDVFVRVVSVGSWLNSYSLRLCMRSFANKYLKGKK